MLRYRLKAAEERERQKLAVNQPRPTRLMIGGILTTCGILIYVIYQLLTLLGAARGTDHVLTCAVVGSVFGFVSTIMDDRKLAFNEHGLTTINGFGWLYLALRITLSVTGGVAASYVATQALPGEKNTNEVILGAVAFAAAYARDLTSRLPK
jgi:hypothetical protein